MARRSSIYSTPAQTKESRVAEKLGKLLTEDMGIDLERVGYYLVRNLPRIIYHRFDAVALSVEDEYGKLVGDEKGRPKW